MIARFECRIITLIFTRNQGPVQGWPPTAKVCD
jgi:hypothetical protein